MAPRKPKQVPAADAADENNGNPEAATDADATVEADADSEIDTDSEIETEDDETDEDDPRPVGKNGLKDGGTPVFAPHPDVPAKAEIIPDADFAISIRGVTLQFREGKKTSVEPDVLQAIKDAGAPYRAQG